MRKLNISRIDHVWSLYMQYNRLKGSFLLSGSKNVTFLKASQISELILDNSDEPESGIEIVVEEGGCDRVETEPLVLLACAPVQSDWVCYGV